jgi:hypothetical protein
LLVALTNSGETPGGLALHRTKSLSKAFVIAAIAAVTITPFLASPAGAKTATTTVTGCAVTAPQPGAEIGMYPAFDGAESSLIVACTFEYDSTNQEVSGNFHIEDFANNALPPTPAYAVQWHNGSGRRFTISAKAVGPPGTLTVAAPDCSGGALTNGLSATTLVHHTISADFQTLGHGIKANTFIQSVAGCVLTVNQALQGAGPAVGATIVLDNSTAHNVLDGGTTAASCVVTTASALASDVGLSISGTNIPRYASITSAVAGTSVTYTVPAPSGPLCSLATASAQQIEIGGSQQNTNFRVVSDSTSTCSTPSTVHSVIAKWKSDDVGLKIQAPCITGGSGYILTVSGANVTVSSGVSAQAATQTTIIVGEQSITAPLTGDPIINQSVALDLSPQLVTGTDACDYEHVEGFGITGTWSNPGAFDAPSLFLVAQPTNTVAIAELKFTTSVITYAGYVLQYASSGGGQINTLPHYTLDFPGTPTTAALCPATGDTYVLGPNSPGLGFAIEVPAVTASQAAIGSGIGKPSSAEVRATPLSPTFDGATTTFGTVVDDSGSPTLPWNSGALQPYFTRLCSEPSSPTPLPLVNFKCGQ